ncbi:glycosyltransferase [Planococcus soli]|uniref:glycosyltransferase n=1 Tax=Planococcus soli TaxID=2666072 RepID=UPI00115EE7E8|nr:glycosyltransferase [Planococcus soli]
MNTNINKTHQNLRGIDFLFVGGVIPKEIEKEVLKKTKKAAQLAANNFQWSLIKGFDANLENPVTIINTMFVGSYPKNYTDILVPEKYFSHAVGANDISLGFLNLTVIKQFIRPFKEKENIKKWLSKSTDCQKMVFIYSLEPRFVRIAKIIKKNNPNALICISVNDLPQYAMLSNQKNNIIFRAWKKINQIRVDRGKKYIDSFMIVTEEIAAKLEVENKPYRVIEALVDTTNDSEFKISSANGIKKTIVYTGGLTAKYGLLNLVEAFKKIESDSYQLVICGDGETKDNILAAAKEDPRIKYLGVLSPEKIKEIQCSASVLVNPRQNTEEFTRYSFPIKTIEYLLAGVPVIGYKLHGVPEEYDKYLIYVEENSIDALKEKIVEVCNLSPDQRVQIGQFNRAFVLKNKNHIIQTKKILDMMLSSKNRKI